MYSTSIALSFKDCSYTGSVLDVSTVTLTTGNAMMLEWAIILLPWVCLAPTLTTCVSSYK